jgi:hypothetical protein
MWQQHCKNNHRCKWSIGWFLGFSYSDGGSWGFPTLEVHVTQPQMDQQNPHPPYVPQMMVLEPLFIKFRPPAIVLQ